MTDIGTSVAMHAQRTGRNTRMTDHIARQEENLLVLARALDDLQRRRADAQAFVQEAIGGEAYLKALIERERVNPTLVPDPPHPAVPSTPGLVPPGPDVKGTAGLRLPGTVPDSAAPDAEAPAPSSKGSPPSQHGIGSTMSGSNGGDPHTDSAGAPWPLGPTP